MTDAELMRDMATCGGRYLHDRSPDVIEREDVHFRHLVDEGLVERMSPLSLLSPGFELTIKGGWAVYDMANGGD